MLLRSRLVLPMAQAPIEDGAVEIIGSKITQVGPWSHLAAGQGPVVDLGDCVLLPGLVNAHCHLDYSNMAGLIGAPKNFTDWIQAIVNLKAHWSYTEYAASWLNGARMLLQSGVTTVADTEAAPELIPDLWKETPLRVLSFRELIHLKAESAEKTVAAALADWAPILDSAGDRLGLSPHALYSTTPELLRAAAKTARQRTWRLSCHVAESADEFAMFRHGRGPLFQWLNGQRSLDDCGSVSPVLSLDRLGCLDENFLAIHANYLDSGDAEILGRRRTTVVHCPRSHEYFAHQPFPYETLRSAKVNTCLGTDSLATVLSRRGQPSAPELNLFTEMEAFSRRMPGVDPQEIVEMVTRCPARALGRVGRIGELSPGACADVIAIPYTGSTSAIYEMLTRHSGFVQHGLIDGEWVLGPNVSSHGS